MSALKLAPYNLGKLNANQIVKGKNQPNEKKKQWNRDLVLWKDKWNWPASSKIEKKQKGQGKNNNFQKRNRAYYKFRKGECNRNYLIWQVT